MSTLVAGFLLNAVYLISGIVDFHTAIRLVVALTLAEFVYHLIDGYRFELESISNAEYDDDRIWNASLGFFLTKV